MSSDAKEAAAAADGAGCDSEEDDASYEPSECSSAGDGERARCDGGDEPTGPLSKRDAHTNSSDAGHAAADVDAMWAEFLSDVGDGGPASPADHAAAAAGGGNATQSATSGGVAAATNCASAQLGNDNTVEEEAELESTRQGGTDDAGSGRKRKGGFESVNLKKGKTSTLAASRDSWHSFKTEAGLHEELRTYNRGTGGYLSRRDFLQRADERRFECEKSVRDAARRRRT